jgi:cobyrinic acid a,c-diamide synthase
MKRIVIAAPHSGSGKTTLTLGIMAALKKRGLSVAPFKVGPDFIDPGYHTLVTGSPSINLDGWICDHGFIRQSFAHHAAGAEIAVVEGVMGLFDGIDGVSEAGSTAQVAKLLSAPVILVVDARSQARSAAALVHGFATFDLALRVAGVIFNNVASANHEAILREAVSASSPGIAILGCLPKDPALAIPSRHLGLLTAEENPLTEEFLDHLVAVIEEHLDLEAMLQLCCCADLSAFPPLPNPLPPGERECLLPPREREGLFPSEECLLPSVESGGLSPLPSMGGAGGGWNDAISGCAGIDDVQGVDRVRIAVARDQAFCFVYQDNLRLFREQGAELCYFSPLNDSALPDGISGIYLPGGYPEVFAAKLAGNQQMKQQISEAVEAGLPVYAECGGFIYLTQGVRADDGTHAFVGVFPTLTRMLPRRKALGYRSIELAAESVIGPAGMRARGHEFHYSEMEEMPAEVERIYQVTRKCMALGPEGYRYKNCLASYIHLHFGSSPLIAESFVGHCKAYRTRSLT